MNSTLREELEEIFKKIQLGENEDGETVYLIDQEIEDSIKAIEILIQRKQLEAEIELWKNFELDLYPYLPPSAKLDFDKIMRSKEAELKALKGKQL